MDMDGTVGRKRTQTHTETWAEPWYEYEHDDTRGNAYEDMDETKERRARRHKENTHGWTWTEPWDDDACKDTQTQTRNLP